MLVTDMFGVTSLTKGIDCSGFTMRVYEHFGISLHMNQLTDLQVTDLTANSVPTYGTNSSSTTTANYLDVAIRPAPVAPPGRPRPPGPVPNGGER